MVAVAVVVWTARDVQVVGDDWLAATGGIILENVDFIAAAQLVVASFVVHPEGRPPALVLREAETRLIIAIAEVLARVEADGVALDFALLVLLPLAADV